MTLKQYNEKIKKEFPSITMYHGRGYFYFIDEKTSFIPASIYICWLKDLQIDWVMDHLRYEAEEYTRFN